jgi:hypothetical protein
MGWDELPRKQILSTALREGFNSDTNYFGVAVLLLLRHCAKDA